MARNGLPSFNTIVGVSVVRGRLPPTSTFGLSGSRSNTVIRFESGTPVSPAMNAPDSSQPELGVALKRLPSLSTTSTQVVWPATAPLATPCEWGVYRAGGALTSGSNRNGTPTPGSSEG